MTDPLFFTLKSLKIILERITSIFSFIFTNYFPEDPPKEESDTGFVDIDILH